MESELDHRRVNRCRAAIRDVFGTPADEVGGTLFLTHHLEELNDDYWLAHFGDASPTPARIIDALVPLPDRSQRDPDGGYSIDFTLPGGVTNYVVCVRIDSQDDADVTMES